MIMKTPKESSIFLSSPGSGFGFGWPDVLMMIAPNSANKCQYIFVCISESWPFTIHYFVFTDCKHYIVGSLFVFHMAYLVTLAVTLNSVAMNPCMSYVRKSVPTVTQSYFIVSPVRPVRIERRG